MKLIPDYAHQATELSRQLEAQAEVTAHAWSDMKRVEYYTKYIEEYLKWIDNYITGNEICGKGLNDLLQFVSDKIQEFEEAAESSISGDIIAPEYYSSSSPVTDAHQIMMPANAQSSDVTSVIPDANIPAEQTPDTISNNRYNAVVDYNLNGPGSFSAQNLREILKGRNQR